MQITITMRHCEIPDALRERARVVLERLHAAGRPPEDAQVIFAADHGEATVELRLHRAPGLVHVALASGADHRSALDRAVAKLRRQLERPAARARRARPTSEPSG